MIVKQSLDCEAPASLWIPDKTRITDRNIMTGQKYNNRTENQSGTGAPHSVRLQAHLYRAVQVRSI